MNRWPAIAVAVVLLAAACGDDDAADPAAGSTSTAVTAPPGEGSATSTAGSATTTIPAANGAGHTTSTSGPGAAGGQPPVTLDANVPVGDFAPAILRADRSDRLVLEIHADASPRQGTLDHVSSVLRDVSGKQVSVVGAGAPGGGERAWTNRDLTEAADAASTTPQGGGVAVVRLLFVHGTFEGDDGVLGVAVRGDVAAVFIDRVEASGGLLGGGAGIEVAVTTHELGHLLGLVDLYRDTGRADPEHPGHSRNEGSVMYWAVESDLVGQILGANPPADFDADDLADLAAVRAGA